MPDSQSSEVATSQPVGKWWGSSLTIWGALITAASTVAPTVLSAFGLDVPGVMIERLGGDILVVVQAIAGLAGTIMTIAGRSRAALPLARRAVSLRV